MGPAPACPATVTENGDKRPWLAALLAMVYPGLGHVYLRLWGRAFVWSAMAVLTATLFVPEDVGAVVRAEGVGAAAGAVPETTVFMLVSVVAMAALDAYWHASHGAAAARRGDAATCPECGKEVDQDLTFCQWCTAELDPASG